jgi:hypothetical protein
MRIVITDAIAVDAVVEGETEATPAAGYRVEVACRAPTRPWPHLSERPRKPLLLPA